MPEFYRDGSVNFQFLGINYHAFQVMSKVDGHKGSTGVFQDWEPALREQIGVDIADALFKFHQCAKEISIPPQAHATEDKLFIQAKGIEQFAQHNDDYIISEVCRSEMEAGFIRVSNNTTRPQMVIHGDANFGNLMFENSGQEPGGLGRVTGFIDFADTRRTHLEYEFAKLANDPVVMLATIKRYERLAGIKIDMRYLLMAAVADSYYYYRLDRLNETSLDRSHRRREALLQNLSLCVNELTGPDDAALKQKLTTVYSNVSAEGETWRRINNWPRPSHAAMPEAA